MGGYVTDEKRIIKEILDWALHVVIAVVIGLLIVNFVGQITIVNKTSMLPTLKDKDVLIIEKISPRLKKIKAGDIVTIKDINVGGVEETIIKRVIAVENDLVEIRDGKVYVNGEEIEEDYINSDYTYPTDPRYSKIKIPEGCVYVLGDNRLPNESLDSRTFGPVKVSKISGRAFIRIFPFKRFGFI